MGFNEWPSQFSIFVERNGHPETLQERAESSQARSGNGYHYGDEDKKKVETGMDGDSELFAVQRKMLKTVNDPRKQRHHSVHASGEFF